MAAVAFIQDNAFLQKAPAVMRYIYKASLVFLLLPVLALWQAFKAWQRL